MSSTGSLQPPGRVRGDIAEGVPQHVCPTPQKVRQVQQPDGQRFIVQVLAEGGHAQQRKQIGAQGAGQDVR